MIRMADDLISRQAAITAIQKAYADTEGGMDKLAVWKNVGLTNALHIMQDLPSAQPEIIRCEDCKHWEGERRGQFYYFEQCSLHECTASSDDFCSWAERREE